MGGNIIEFEALKIKRAGMQEGMQAGMQAGMQEGLQQGEKNGEANAYRVMAERMISAGKPGDEIRMFTNLGRQDIDVIAKRLNRTVSWKDAMV